MKITKNSDGEKYLTLSKNEYNVLKQRYSFIRNAEIITAKIRSDIFVVTDPKNVDQNSLIELAKAIKDTGGEIKKIDRNRGVIEAVVDGDSIETIKHFTGVSYVRTVFNYSVDEQHNEQPQKLMKPMVAKVSPSNHIYRAGSKFANGVDFASLKKSLAQGGFDDFDTQRQIEETPEAQRAENIEDAQHMPQQAQVDDVIRINVGQFKGKTGYVTQIRPGGIVVADVDGKEYTFRPQSFEIIPND